MTLCIAVPGSKSVTHRALLLAALADGPCIIHNPLRSGDTLATRDGLRAFGYLLDDAEGAAITTRPATGHAGGKVDMANCGTGLRLLTAHAALHPGATAFQGDHSLSLRPNGPLLEALSHGGANVQGGPTLPYRIRGTLVAGDYALPACVSSQYASALLLALPSRDGDSTLRLAEPVSSRPYIDVTLQVAKAFGIRVDRQDDGFAIAGGQRPRATTFTVEGDWSSAAFPAVAAAITGTRVKLEGLRADSTQGDRALLDVIRRFGASVHGHEVQGDVLESPGTVDVQATPDMFPALCILAAASRGTTTFTGGDALRDKESDRIQAMQDGLQALGIRCQASPDGLIVEGGRMQGGTVHSHHDHRIHMAFSIAGLVTDGPVHVDGASSVRISYPTFHDDLERLRRGS